MRLTPLFRQFDIRWSKAGSAALFARPRADRARARRGGRRDAVLRARGRPAGEVHDRPPARRLPDGRRPAPAAWSTTPARVHGYPACTCSTARSCRPRSASTRRRRSRRSPSAAAARLRGGAGLSAEWRNHTGNQRCRPRADRPARRRSRSSSRSSRRAEQEGTTVRAVGAGPRVVGRRADRRLPRRARPAERAARRSTTGRCGRSRRETRLVRVLGGTRVRELNAALDRAGLALPNMGGYDAQTIAGVVSTSTHGSGLRCGPFPDLVRSLDLVVSGGEVRARRAAPTARPIPPPSRRPRRRAAPGPGRARVPGGGLRHRRARAHPLARARGAREVLAQRGAHGQHLGGGPRRRSTADGVLGEGDHYELFVNPYARKGGDHRVLVTRRGDCPSPSSRRRTRASATRSPSWPRAADHRRAAAPRRAHGAVAARVALRRDARRHGRRRLRRGLLPRVQHRRGEQAAGLLDGARRARSRATATSRPSTGSWRSPGAPQGASR